MPKIYKQNCKQCGKYYERPGAKYFCCLYCANINLERIAKLKGINLGRKHTDEAKIKIGLASKGNKYSLGRKHSKETKKKQSEVHKKLFSLPEYKEKHKQGIVKFWDSKKGIEVRARYRITKSGKNSYFFGKHWNKETKKKILKTRKANYKKENHYNWRGGVSYLPYPVGFNKDLKKKIKERDNYICQLCGKTEKEELKELKRVLCVNHIDFDKNNCFPENLNTLCVKCNVKINYDREKYTRYFQERINYV